MEREGPLGKSVSRQVNVIGSISTEEGDRSGANFPVRRGEILNNPQSHRERSGKLWTGKALQLVRGWKGRGPPWMASEEREETKHSPRREGPHSEGFKKE